MDSVEGHRCRPSGLNRFDLLKLVASRPDLRANPDALNPWRDAREVNGSPNTLVRQHSSGLRKG